MEWDDPEDELDVSTLPGYVQAEPLDIEAAIRATRIFEEGRRAYLAQHPEAARPTISAEEWLRVIGGEQKKG